MAHEITIKVTKKALKNFRKILNEEAELSLKTDEETLAELKRQLEHDVKHDLEGYGYYVAEADPID